MFFCADYVIFKVEYHATLLKWWRLVLPGSDSVFVSVLAKFYSSISTQVVSCVYFDTRSSSTPI